MQFDWTIQPVPLLVFCTVIFVTWKFILPVHRAFMKLMTILEEYPPHRHVGTKTVFPRGLSPVTREKDNEHPTFTRADE